MFTLSNTKVMQSRDKQIPLMFMEHMKRQTLFVFSSVGVLSDQSQSLPNLVSDYHDVLIFPQISVQTINNKHPSFFLWIYFQLALHVSALRPWSHAVAYCTKTKGARLNFTFTSTFTSESESKIHTNRSLQRSSHGKN